MSCLQYERAIALRKCDASRCATPPDVRPHREKQSELERSGGGGRIEPGDTAGLESFLKEVGPRADPGNIRRILLGEGNGLI
jgi:hypothetical protein